MSEGAAAHQPVGWEQRVNDANEATQDQVAASEAAHEATKERRANRTLEEKLADMAAGAQAKVDKLTDREYKLVQELGKVRGELQKARTSLGKLHAAAASDQPDVPHEDPA